MTQTDPQISGQFPTADQVYDRIMKDIEPELLTVSNPTLAEKYKDETPEESQARAERYQKAYAEYDKKYEAYMLEFDGMVRGLQHEAVGVVEGESKKGDDDALATLESGMASQ